METTKNIVKQLPYGKPFLFVDDIQFVNLEQISGTYTFPEKAPFYEAHFPQNPVTPGVLLLECMAQIGLVCFGYYLLRNEKNKNRQFALASSAVDFYTPVYPGEMVTVQAEKIYFRFGKLKCKVMMTNATGTLVCKGILSGMLKENTGD